MRSVFVIFLLSIFSTVQAQELVVFAASSLTEAFREIAGSFEAAHEGVDVVLNFAGSSTLSTQILQDAPADVFASADEAQMQTVAGAGLLGSEPQTFTQNRLVVITPQNSPVKTLSDLATPGILLILAGPNVPAGRYALEVLKNLDEVYGADFSRRVLANLVSEETNVRQVAAKVGLGEADAAFVYATDAAVLREVNIIQIPAADNVTARYPIAVLEDTQHPELAQSFVDYVQSARGQEILAERGFTPAQP